jgi:thymidylate kinase
MDIVEHDQIHRNIEASIKSQYVIAHIYSGQQNTSDPAWWISRFRDAGFHTISFVLNISFDAGKKRCLKRDKNRTEEEYRWLWERFQKPPFSDFAKKADVKEIGVDAEQSTDAMCDQILKAIEENTSRKPMATSGARKKLRFGANSCTAMALPQCAGLTRRVRVASPDGVT